MNIHESVKPTCTSPYNLLGMPREAEHSIRKLRQGMLDLIGARSQINEHQFTGLSSYEHGIRTDGNHAQGSALLYDHALRERERGRSVSHCVCRSKDIMTAMRGIVVFYKLKGTLHPDITRSVVATKLIAQKLYGSHAAHKLSINT